MIGSTRYIAAAEIARQSQLAGEISKLQQSISTNKRLNAPSDDPAAASRIAEIRQTQANNAIFTKNATSGVTIAAAADGTLTSVASALRRGKELVLSGSNETATATDRLTYATELRGLADDLDSYAKATDPNGNALFPAGTPTAIPLSSVMTVQATASKAQVFDGLATSTGVKSLAAILRHAADTLTGGDTVPAVDNTGAPILDGNGNPTTITRAAATALDIGDVDLALEHITSEQTDQGIRAQRFDDAKASLADTSTDLKAERSQLEDTDLTYAISAFQSKQLALQAAQTIYAQAHRNTLFDKLG